MFGDISQFLGIISPQLPIYLRAIYSAEIISPYSFQREPYNPAEAKIGGHLVDQNDI